MNFEHLYYQKKLCFVHNMLRSDNSIIVSVMKLFVNSKEFTKLCEFADVTSYDNIHYIRSQLHAIFINVHFLTFNCLQFLADRTNGRTYATVLRLSICRLSVTLCIVAKRCVLEQKLLLRAYRKSYMRNRLVPKCMTLTFV